MPFKSSRISNLWASYPLRVTLLGVLWLLLITFLHFSLNREQDKRQIVKLGYMPVITNLAAPLLDYASSQSNGSFRFRAIKFASFAEMAEALRNNQIQAAFIIAPLSIVLNQQGESVRIVYVGNRHESTLVTRKGLNLKSFRDLDGHTVAVPMRYSGHNLFLLQLMQDNDLQGRIQIVEMNPPDMASALAAGALDAYFVGEPFAAQTLKDGVADLLLHVEQVWPGFICNLLLVRQELIDEQPDLVQSLVQGAARSGLWARKHQDQAAQIASRYWGQPLDVVKYALKTPPDRIVFDRFIPDVQEIKYIAEQMLRFGLIEKAGIDGLVDDRFARQVDLNHIGEHVGSILQDSP